MAFRNIKKIVWEEPVRNYADDLYKSCGRPIEAELFESFHQFCIWEHQTNRAFDNLTIGGISEREADILLKRLDVCCAGDACSECSRIKESATNIIKRRTYK